MSPLLALWICLHAVPERAPALTQPNLAPSELPSPVADSELFYFLLLDNFEYRTLSARHDLRWDILGWWGGDRHRLWFKSEGLHGLTGGTGEGDVQLLYGRLLWPFFDLQAGVRYARKWLNGEGPDGERAYLVLGLQGLAPYGFEVEPALFVSTRGQLSARLTATYDLLLTQRLVLQPRFEMDAALQADAALGAQSGVNEIGLSARARYEIARELAPYVGVSAVRSFAGSAPDSTVWSLVAGLRLWL